MRPKLAIAAISVGVLLTAASAFGHHSLIAEYDVTKPVTLRGTVTRVEWVNPHGWIYLDVERPDGKTENWAIETGCPFSLVRRGLISLGKQGVKTTDLLPGVEIVVNGLLAKNGTRRVAGETVTFPGRDVAFHLGR
jgi:hypothetical protein